MIKSGGRLSRGGALRRRANMVLATVVSLLGMSLLAFGSGVVPPLGPAVDPGAGVWNASAGAAPVKSETIRLPGMRAPATVAFDTAGIPTVRAESEPDAYLVQGYLQARFRLTEMDMERRIAEGRLSEFVGPPGVDSDTFELQIGLLRTAQAELDAMPAGSPQAVALTAFSQGVNAWIADLRRSGDWPTAFALTGVHPKDWTPLDSLAIQGLLTQTLSYTAIPLYLDKYNQTLGPELTKQFFPMQPADKQSPYDPGPYQYLGVAPWPANVNAAAVPGGAPAANEPAPRPAGSPPPAPALDSLVNRIRALPASQIHTFPDSNSWAGNGPAVSGAASLLAGDPHLQLSLPSYWFQMAISAPTLTVSGASLVGLPSIVIGRNADISWSITAVQNQSTFFYSETTSPDHPDQYYWQGGWRPTQKVEYTIPVRGAAAVPLAVDLTVHGPVIETEHGATISVDWTGNHPGQALRTILALDKATSWNEFHQALAGWVAPTLNFSYADGAGDIGVIAAGAFPVVKAGEAWRTMPGTGEDDIVGAIPYAAQPQVYNPPGHVLATTNQRPVTADYPYYIGTSLFFDNGYRANRLYSELDGRTGLTADDYAAMQTDVTDYLSTLIVPKLGEALQGAQLTAEQRQALGELMSWDHRMSVDATGATVWWTFWTDYLSMVFQPWWDAKHVPTDDTGYDVTAGFPSLNEDLEAWTLGDQDNPAFSPPGASRNATVVMRAAFAKAVADLHEKLGADPGKWTWGRVHSRSIPSITGAADLGYGPVSADGTRWTVNAADGDLNSSFGPSWRMVVDWDGPGTATARADYPGGQSDNPASPWYQNLVADFMAGRLRAMPWPARSAPGGGAVWTLQAGG